MKTLIVREAFALGAEFFARGAEITDPALIDQAKAEYPGHVIESQFDAEETKPVENAALTEQADTSPLPLGGSSSIKKSGGKSAS